MSKHYTILASLFLCVGILHVIGMIVVLAIFFAGSAVLFTVGAHDPDVPEIVKFLPAGFGSLIALIIAVTGIPNLFAAYGLFRERHWAPILALILGIFNLPSVPFGTALGIYAIWVYANSSTQERRPGNPITI